MSKKSSKQVQKNVDKMIKSTVGLLEDLHILHKQTAVDELLAIKVPGADITVAKLVRNLLNILTPFLDIVRMQYPGVFLILDWARMVVEAILKI
jgi:Ni,Fe-hydrogenase I large subunit